MEYKVEFSIKFHSYCICSEINGMPYSEILVFGFSNNEHAQEFLNENSDKVDAISGKDAPMHWRELTNEPSGKSELTIRDQFAMAALTGLCAHLGHRSDIQNENDLSEMAYNLADAMLKECEK